MDSLKYLCQKMILYALDIVSTSLVKNSSGYTMKGWISIIDDIKSSWIKILYSLAAFFSIWKNATNSKF